MAVLGSASSRGGAPSLDRFGFPFFLEPAVDPRAFALYFSRT